jgi:hypothetical protein
MMSNPSLARWTSARRLRFDFGCGFSLRLGRLGRTHHGAATEAQHRESGCSVEKKERSEQGRLGFMGYLQAGFRQGLMFGVLGGCRPPDTSGATPPAQGASINLATGRHYVLGNREIGGRTFTGSGETGARW